MSFLKDLSFLPDPPEEFIQQAITIATPDYGDQGNVLTNSWDDPNGSKTHAPRFLRFKLSDEFEQWVHDVIGPLAGEKISDAGVMHCNFNPNQPIGVHTDKTRDYVLMYVIEQGGDNATFSYWQEKGKPIIRDREVKFKTTENLVKISEVRTPTRKWYGCPVRILHSVEHLESRRVNLQISYNLLDDVKLLSKNSG